MWHKRRAGVQQHKILEPFAIILTAGDCAGGACDGGTSLLSGVPTVLGNRGGLSFALGNNECGNTAQFSINPSEPDCASPT